MGARDRATGLRFALSLCGLLLCGSGLASTVNVMDEDAPAPSRSEELLEQVLTSSRRQAAEAAFNLSLIAVERKDSGSAQRFIEEAMLLNPGNAKYLRAAAGFAFRDGDYARAEAYQVAVVELARSRFSGDDPQLAMILDELGIIYLAQSRYTEAESLLEQSLVIREQALGKLHPSLAKGLNDLAGLAMKDGRFDEAEQRLKRALQILETGAGTDDPDTAMALHNLGDFFSNQKRFPEAAATYRRAVDIWKAIPAQERLEITAILNELGNFYRSRKRLDEAKAQFELVAVLLGDDFGQDHPQFKTARAGLEAVKSAGEKRSEAREFSQQMFDELQTLLSGHRRAD